MWWELICSSFSVLIKARLYHSLFQTLLRTVFCWRCGEPFWLFSFHRSCGRFLYCLTREGEGKTAGAGVSTTFVRRVETLWVLGLCFFHRHMQLQLILRVRQGPLWASWCEACSCQGSCYNWYHRVYGPQEPCPGAFEFKWRQFIGSRRPVMFVRSTALALRCLKSSLGVSAVVGSRLSTWALISERDQRAK